MHWLLMAAVVFSVSTASAVEKYCYERESNGRERIEREAYFVSEEPYLEYRTRVTDAQGRQTQNGGILMDRRQHCGQNLTEGCRYFTWDMGGNFKFDFKCGNQVKGTFEINRFGDAQFKCQAAGQPPVDMAFRRCYR